MNNYTKNDDKIKFEQTKFFSYNVCGNLTAGALICSESLYCSEFTICNDDLIYSDKIIINTL